MLALALRLFLFRKVHEGMTARYDRIEGDFAEAREHHRCRSCRRRRLRRAGRRRSCRAQKKVEAARASSRPNATARLAEVNARIANKRAAAAADVDAAKLAARSQVESAVADVASFAGQLATGKTPSPDAVNAAVTEAMGVSA